MSQSSKKYDLPVLSEHQQIIFDQFFDWWENGPADAQENAIRGYAGTGKTTLIAHILSQLSEDVALCAPTGKASLVLSNKMRRIGVSNDASTIHSLIYYPKEDESGNVVFTRKYSLDCDLIVVDESSMVNEELANDLLSFGKPILWVGDVGQLPPVGGSMYYWLEQTDMELSEVHRQALDSPILSLATQVRMQQSVPNHIECTGLYRSSIRDNLAQTMFNQYCANPLVDATIALCGYNKTRCGINKRIRALHGLSHLPHPNERMVVLQNNKHFGVVNGELVTVIQSSPTQSPYLYHIELKTQDGGKFHTYAFLPALGAENSNNLYQDWAKVRYSDKATRHILDEIQESTGEEKPSTHILFLDWGYCLSVHKSQGSEWNNVFLFEERFPRATDFEHNRWLYTGITRAAENLVIMG